MGKKIAVTICEDIWNLDKDLHMSDPLDEISPLQPDLLINLSASPWHHQKGIKEKSFSAGL